MVRKVWCVAQPRLVALTRRAAQRAGPHVEPPSQGQDVASPPSGRAYSAGAFEQYAGGTK